MGISIRDDLSHAVTQYDRAQLNKRNYNVYALGLYLRRVDEIVFDIAEGETLGACIRAGFSGSLQSYVLKYMRKSGHLV